AGRGPALRSRRRPGQPVGKTSFSCSGRARTNPSSVGTGRATRPTGTVAPAARTRRGDAATRKGEDGAVPSLALASPVVAAPMAGGPTTAALLRAVAGAG